MDKVKVFEITCKGCRSHNVEIKATAVEYGARVRCKLHCKDCGIVGELDKNEVSISIEG